MKMKYVSSLFLILMIFAYQNCGQNMASNYQTDQTSLASSSPVDSSAPSNNPSNSDQDPVGTYKEESKAVNPVALLSFDQMLRSMSSLTGVPLNDGTVILANSRVSGLFAANYDITNMSPPMLMGITNLAGTFCQQAIVKERPLADSQRKLFVGVNFKSGPGMFTDAVFQATVEKMALSFWSRQPTAVELKLLATARSEILSGFTATELVASTTTVNLVMGLCTAMLASPDSYTF